MLKLANSMTRRRKYRTRKWIFIIFSHYLRTEDNKRLVMLSVVCANGLLKKKKKKKKNAMSAQDFERVNNTKLVARALDRRYIFHRPLTLSLHTGHKTFAGAFMWSRRTCIELEVYATASVKLYIWLENACARTLI